MLKKIVYVIRNMIMEHPVPELVDEMRVVMVSTVVTPRPTRAGVAPLLSQKETQEMTTMSEEGM